MLRVPLMLVIVFILAFLSTFAVAAESPFNVDCFFGWGGCYRPMEWTPVNVRIDSTLKDPFAGILSLSAAQDGLNSLNISHSFVLTPDIPMQIPLVTKFAFAAEKCTARIANERGRTKWSQEYQLWDFSTRNKKL